MRKTLARTTSLTTDTHERAAASFGGRENGSEALAETPLNETKPMKRHGINVNAIKQR